MKHFVLCLLFSLILASMNAAEPTIRIQTQAQPKEIYIGDPIHVDITVTFPPSFLPLALSSATALGEFDVLSAQSSAPASTKEGNLTQKHSFIVTSFSTGTLTLPGVSLPFSVQGGTQMAEKTPDIEVKVKSLLEEKGDEGNLRPLKGLINFRSYFWFWFTIGMAALGLAGWAVYRAIKKRQAQQAGPAVPARPPHEVAWEALQKLEDSNLIAEGLIKEFYYQLSLIMRDYVEARFQRPALDKTSSELLQEFRDLNLDYEGFTAIRAFLENGDLVKFAKFTPSPEEITEDLNRVKEFLNRTLPKPPKPMEEKKEEEALPL